MWIVWFIFYIVLFINLFIWGQLLLSKLQKFPPGPIRWPILGSIPQMMMIDMAYPYRQFLGLAEKYGPIVMFGYGLRKAVVVSSFEAIRDLFKLHETNTHRFRTPFAEHRSNFENLGILFAGGEEWREIRRFTLKGLREFGFAKCSLMENTYREEVNKLVDDIKNEISTTNGIWYIQPQRLSIVALNTIWSCVGGYTFDPHRDKIQKHVKLNMDIFLCLRANNPLSAFPFLKFFPRMSGHKRECEAHERCRDFMKELVEEAKIRRALRFESENFLDVFLDEIDKANPNSKLTEAQLIAVLMDLFLAGTESTTTVINWFFLYMALNQKCQEKLREEIYQTSHQWTKEISVAKGSKMLYLRACIFETMRHSGFALVSTPRLVTTDIFYAGYKIPEGSCLFYSLYHVYYDNDFWGPDADQFNPQRFFQANANFLDSRRIERVAQFGFGSRICPGESIAMDVITAVVLGLCSTFKIGLVQGQEAKLVKSKPSLSIPPKPYCVRLEEIVH